MSYSKFNKFKNHESIKGCFKEDKYCSDKVINAHSIQNNRILNRISRDGYVMYYDYTSSWGEMNFEMVECGRNKATTFRGFCKYHDTKLFEAIELKDYVINDKEQEFLFAYRALAKEYYDKNSVLNISKKIVGLLKNKDYKKLKELFPNFDFTYNGIGKLLESYEAIVAGSKVASKRLSKNRDAMNINIEKGRFSKISTDRIIFNNEYKIAVSSACIVQYDLEGNIINNLNEAESSYISPLFLTIFPQKGKTYILFSYFSKDKNIFEFINKQIVGETEDRQKLIISNLIVCYIENFVLSPDDWDKMSKTRKNRINEIFRETVYFNPHGLSEFIDINLFI